ncbi:MAG TPA: hypothetical protein VGH82_06330 [Gaiellaceae bacterium]
MPRIEFDRDRALRRLRRTSTVAGVAAGALVGVFAGLAAKAFPGHHAVHTSNAPVSVAQRQATPPPLVPVESQAAPSPPTAPPTPTSAPPVVASGGS